ncbi:MAG: PHP domain-containing protein [Nitrospiraceae bacterium]|nr:MAG: PHP domain-containing protein [Nitrospiraceae bacterium]
MKSTMLIDLHIHTYRYSGCSILDPVDLVRRAEELNLAGFALTEHDYVWTEEEVRELREETGTALVILRGQEVSSPAGHVLVFGCYDRLDRLPARDMLSRVREQGGVAIPSHPFRYGDYALDSLDLLAAQLAEYDGFEALNGNQTDDQNSYGMHAWERLGIAGTGGSDSHEVDMVGRFITEFTGGIQNEADLVAEIKKGRCRPAVLRHARIIHEIIK